jgi:hypothetical protein
MMIPRMPHLSERSAARTVQNETKNQQFYILLVIGVATAYGMTDQSCAWFGFFAMSRVLIMVGNYSRIRL